jgi:AbrB family looped-hinge helix DNA binding protein
MGLEWYDNPMEATVDSGGRIVVPKVLREALGLAPGSTVDISPYGGGLMIIPGGRTARLVEIDGLLVGTSQTPIDDDDVFALIDAGRK